MSDFKSLSIVVLIAAASGCHKEDGPRLGVIIGPARAPYVESIQAGTSYRVTYMAYRPSWLAWRDSDSEDVRGGVQLGATHDPSPAYSINVEPEGDGHSARVEIDFTPTEGGVYALRFADSFQRASRELAETYKLETPESFPSGNSDEYFMAFSRVLLATHCNPVRSVRIIPDDTGRVIQLAYGFFEQVPSDLELIAEHLSVGENQVWMDGAWVEPVISEVAVRREPDDPEHPREAIFAFENPESLPFAGEVRVTLRASDSLAGTFNEDLSCETAPYVDTVPHWGLEGPVESQLSLGTAISSVWASSDPGE